MKFDKKFLNTVSIKSINRRLEVLYEDLEYAKKYASKIDECASNPTQEKFDELYYHYERPNHADYLEESLDLFKNDFMFYINKWQKQAESNQYYTQQSIDIATYILDLLKADQEKL